MAKKPSVCVKLRRGIKANLSNLLKELLYGYELCSRADCFAHMYMDVQG